MLLVGHGMFFGFLWPRDLIKTQAERKPTRFYRIYNRSGSLRSSYYASHLFHDGEKVLSVRLLRDTWMNMSDTKTMRESARLKFLLERLQQASLSMDISTKGLG
jgi:hypothetical protein